MIKQKLFSILILTLILTFGYAQKSVNQFDKNGERHGLWTKNYHKTNQKRYEGVFNHGKEIDTFKYYTLSNGKSVLSAIKVFNAKNNIAEATFYTSKKMVISKGKMDGKLYIGEWIFYHKNTTKQMIVENYDSNGKLNGERKVFYETGVIAEIANYKQGKLHGESKWFFKSKKPLRQSIYQSGLLEGKTINYDSKGNVTSEGNYKKDKKAGIWKYYKGGKITKEIDHTNQKVIKKYE
ncbi:toxin-antitoxin system YwqK family antitoxin [uncultured Winogradskyella sp.]|uniref:toxin-antitoxin system YwqK family antitoxin n=1 Tax=uncultured Winogradskyella sp. TaxID=395353 RepID=UPI00260E4478|nr:toxin-antitoxin system YwqK family antitoxin [uncultured Winogradskyella sp.]